MKRFAPLLFRGGFAALLLGAALATVPLHAHGHHGHGHEGYGSCSVSGCPCRGYMGQGWNCDNCGHRYEWHW